jgi:hypothetical protein
MIYKEKIRAYYDGFRWFISTPFWKLIPRNCDVCGKRATHKLATITMRSHKVINAYGSPAYRCLEHSGAGKMSWTVN